VLHGRDLDVEQLGRLLTPGAAVTLSGPAGIGKSALARAVARGGHHDPVWYVELADVDDPASAATSIARQTGFTAPLPSDPSGVLASAFRGAEGLLVLDTCEHLVPDVAWTIDAIRNKAPALTVLTTSRRPLELADETVHRLTPLTTPDDGGRLSTEELSRLSSVSLFVERATRVRGDFHLDETTAEDIAAIARGMEGLPLGIELAAANADVLDAKGIRQRLSSLLGPAADTTSPGPRRRASLTAALDSSCVLLTPQEKSVFAPLAVFRGAFDLDAVQAVVGPDTGDPYPTLASLVRQSMVSHEGDQTYRLLRPLRTYAADKLAASADHDRVRDRHARYLATASSRAARELRTSTTALTRLQRLLPDARAAVEWSLAHGRHEQAADIATAYTWYWAINGLAEEGIGWLAAVANEVDKARVTDRPSDPRREAAVLRCLGLLSNPVGSVREAGEYCRRALQLSRSVDDQPGTTAALLTLGIADWALGDFAAAATSHDEAIHLATCTGERWHRLAALTLRARTALDAGESDAVERIEAAIAAGQEGKDLQMLSIAMSLLARHHLGTGQVDASAVAAEHALRHARRLHYREGELGALNLLGRARLARGHVTQATAWFTEALKAAVDIRHRGAMCETLESLALSAAASGRHEHAYLLLRVSSRERDRLGMQAPAFGAHAVAQAEASTAEILGSATALVDAKVTVMTFHELVDELLSNASFGEVLMDELHGDGPRAD
jgi:predicted ATPase